MVFSRVNVTTQVPLAELWLESQLPAPAIGKEAFVIHELIGIAPARLRRWATTTFNAPEFGYVRGLDVLEP